MYYTIAVIVILGLLGLRIYIVKQQRARREAKHQEEQKRFRAEKEEARAKVRYLTIRQLREALEPGLTEPQYLDLCFRMSLRSAMLAIRKLGLVPATYATLSDKHTPRPLKEAVVAFAGALMPTVELGAEKWAAQVVVPERYAQIYVWMGIGFDLIDDSYVAAVEPGTTFAGKFPPEWEKCWANGEPAVMIQSLTTGAFITV